MTLRVSMDLLPPFPADLSPVHTGQALSAFFCILCLVSAIIQPETGNIQSFVAF